MPPVSFPYAVTAQVFTLGWRKEMSANNLNKRERLIGFPFALRQDFRLSAPAPH